MSARTSAQSQSRTKFASPKRCQRRSEEHTSELQSQSNLVCRLLLEKKNAQLCPCPTVGRRSLYIEEARICSSLTTRTQSPTPAQPRETHSHATGPTMDSCQSIRIKC